MTLAEVVDQVIAKLSASTVSLDIPRPTIEGFVNPALLEARVWHDEPAVFVTKVMTPSSLTAGFVDLSGETLPVKYVRDVYPVQMPTQTLSDIVRDLLLLPAAPLETSRIVETAYWKMSWPMVKQMLGREMTYKWDKGTKRLYVDDYPTGVVTVTYVPLPMSMEAVSDERTIQWIVEMVEAQTMLTMSRVRGKFRQGGMNFDTDASDMQSQAEDRIRALREALKTASFRPVIRGGSY